MSPLFNIYCLNSSSYGPYVEVFNEKIATPICFWMISWTLFTVVEAILNLLEMMEIAIYEKWCLRQN